MKRVAAFCLVLLALGACAKNQQSGSSAQSSPSAPAAAAVAQNGAAANDGAKVYETNCSSCHEPNGRGLEPNFPPLAANPVVTGNAQTVIHIVKYGLSGKVSIEGKDYDGMMPAWAQQLSDADIATVVTYIRSAWGNNAGAVGTADVSAVSQ